MPGNEPDGNVAGGSAVQLEVGSLQCFDPKGDATTLSSRWKKWRRAFHLYVTSKGVTDGAQKVALLLHTGGLELQEIYYTLVADDVVQTFDAALKTLDDYFVPKSHAPYERLMFRRLEQAHGENVDQFVCRLRQKAASCEFSDVDEAIRDQLIEKCRDDGLRRKFLEKPGTVTLTELQDVARAYEAVNQKMQSMESSKSSQVNAVGSRKQDNKAEKGKQSSRGGRNKKPNDRGGRRCYRCNGTNHLAQDKNCPAHDKECHRCKKVGHYSVCCKTKLPDSQSKAQEKDTREKAYQVNEGDTEDYAFSVQEDNSSREGMVDVTLGGVKLNSVLIDSGASCNLMDQKTWSYLKQQGVKCSSRRSTKKLFAYGQTNPLEITGIIEGTLECESSGKDCVCEFVVIQGSGKTLLGKNTAERLDVLRVGPPRPPHVYSVTTEGSDADIRHEFQDIFAGIGKLNDYQIKLHVNEDVKPVAQPVRRIPFGLRDKVDEQLDELLKEDIIEEVSDKPTEWVSPLVVVPKANGKDIRICVDMRRANEAIVRERHPIPTIEEVLYDLNGATVFSKLDLKWGFHQIELEEESRKITTFVTHRGLYRYKRLMFGIASAPEKYQKIIRDTLAGCPGVANMADDVIIYGVTVEEHDRNLFKVLQRLRERGLTLNGRKCEFRLSQLTFFGHNLSKRGVAPSEEKVAAIQKAKAPQNVSETRSFLGLVQYCAKFLPNFAQVSEPLWRLTRKDQTFVWDTPQEESFQKLKELITRAETLAYFKAKAKTRIVADAGPAGIGAILTQLQRGVWRVISYASRSLTDVERRYSQTEKEALALVWACERFNLYVYGRKFELETDHKPLECIYNTTSKPSARIERWVLRLQSYEYKVVYRPGKTNIADALSRLNQTNQLDPSGDSIDVVRLIVEESMPAALSARQVEEESGRDPELTRVREYIQTRNWSECKMVSYLSVKNELCVLGKLVLRGTRIVIPESLRREVLHLAHEGHQGIVKVKNRLRSKVWWPKIDKDAEKMCRSCHPCQVVGEFCPPEPMQRVEPPTGPWQDVAVDLLGPLPTGENLLVIVDYYSRFYEVVIMQSTRADKVIDALRPIFARYGYPFTLKSDNGPQFVSAEFEKFLEECGIAHRKSTPWWPQANGEVERQNRSLVKMLKIARIEGKPWKEELHKFLIAYRSTPQVTTGQTPAYLMFGRELKTKLPELRREQSMLDEGTRDHDWENKLAGKVYADDKRSATPSDIKPGDQVLVKNTKETGKLAPNFEVTPYTVSAKEGQEMTVVSQEGIESKRNPSSVKPFITAEKPLDSPTSSSTVAVTRVPEKSTPQKSPKPVARDRPARKAGLHPKFQDYVMLK